MPIRKTRLARYLPTTTSQSRTGEVSSSSMVPNFCSSAKRRMVRVGASKINMIVAPWKKLLIDACGKGLLKSRTKKKLAKARNIMATIYAVGLEK